MMTNRIADFGWGQ